MILNLKINFLIFVNESLCSEIVISMQITKKLMDKFCISLYLREQYKYTLTDLFLVFSELIRPISPAGSRSYDRLVKQQL